MQPKLAQLAAVRHGQRKILVWDRDEGDENIVSRQENLWIREFVRLTRENRAVDPQTDARLNAYLAQERGWLIADFKKLPPDIVLIDNLRDGWGEWARADSELTKLPKPYMLVRSIEGIDTLRRAE